MPLQPFLSGEVFLNQSDCHAFPVLGACVFTLVCLFNENKLSCTNSFAGSNGHEFVFLLKGHEDLRQDERVMQLFGLVNTLLANDPTSLRKNLRCVLCVFTENACAHVTPYMGAALQVNLGTSSCFGRKWQILKLS